MYIITVHYETGKREYDQVGCLEEVNKLLIYFLLAHPELNAKKITVELKRN